MPHKHACKYLQQNFSKLRPAMYKNNNISYQMEFILEHKASSILQDQLL